MTHNSRNKIIENFFEKVKEKFETKIKHSEDTTKSFWGVEFKDGKVMILWKYWMTLGQSSDTSLHWSSYTLDELLGEETSIGVINEKISTTI
jgi:hypothetical protein